MLKKDEFEELLKNNTYNQLLESSIMNEKNIINFIFTNCFVYIIFIILYMLWFFKYNTDYFLGENLKNMN